MRVLILLFCGTAIWAQAPAAQSPVEARSAAIEANTVAQAGLRQNDFRGAVADATRALALDPSYLPAFITRAQAESRLLDDAAAKDDATQALTVAHTAAEREQLYTVRATAEQNLGEFEAAIADTRLRLKTAPRLDLVYVRLAELERLAGQLNAAFDDVNTAVQGDPANPQAYRERALIDRLRKNEDGARASFAKLKQMDTDSLRLAAGRGPSPAAAAGPPPPPPPAVGASPREAALTWRDIGLARTRQNDVLGAIEAYTLAISADATYFDAYLSRAGLAERNADFDAGIADATQALQLAATAAQRDQANSARATLEVAAGLYDAAIADLRQTLDTSARPDNSHYRIAIAARDRGDLPTALQEFNAAIAINPQDANYFHQRAAIERRQGNAVQADTDAASARQLAAAVLAAGRGAPGRGVPAAPPPTPAEAELNTKHAALDTAFRNGDYTAALNLAQQILVAAPNDIVAHNMAANCFLHMKDFGAAATEFQKALALQPDEYHNLTGLLEADYRGGLHDPGSQAALDRIRQMAHDLKLPYGVSYYADSFAIGTHKILVQECDNLCGKFQFRYRFEVSNAQDVQEIVFQTESNDFDQAQWAKSHPDLLHAGQREFSLDAYRLYQPGEKLPPPGAMSATKADMQLHITYAMFDQGEPTYDRVRALVTKIVQAMKPVVSGPVGAIGTLR